MTPTSTRGDEGLRIVITGGGTGGHIYPALAVAEQLKADPETAQVVYIGNQTSLEQELIPRHGIPFEGISFYGMPRRPGFGFIRWLWTLQTAIRSAKAHLKSIRPHVVFGTGGYVSAPVLMAARQLRIPYMIHEPDAHPGLVNRLMARQADQVTAAFAESHAMLHCRKFAATGNPLRGKILSLAQESRITKADALAQLGVNWDPNRPVLLVVGGSQGARTLNNAITGALSTLIDSWGVQVLHQTGAKLYEETLQSLSPGLREHPAYRVQPFYNDMWLALACADFALCRAGSLTLSEMYLSEVPTILVPYPHAAANHQHKNAMASVSAGASCLIPDEACTSQQVLAVLDDLIQHPEKPQAMRAACRTLAHPKATDEIIALLKGLAPSPSLP